MPASLDQIMTYVEDGEFRDDSTDFLIESVLGELDLSHVDYKSALDLLYVQTSLQFLIREILN